VLRDLLVPMARNNVAGVEPGGHGQRVPHVVRGQVAQRRVPGEFDHWLEHMPVLGDRGGRPAVEPVAEPVVDGLAHGVGRGRLDTRGDVVAKVPGLVTDLGLDAAADCAAPALAVGGEAEDTDVTQAYRQALV
jgi:hypothetical protein